MDCYPEERYVFSASRVALKTFYMAFRLQLGLPSNARFPAIFVDFLLNSTKWLFSVVKYPLISSASQSACNALHIGFFRLNRSSNICPSPINAPPPVSLSFDRSTPFLPIPLQWFKDLQVPIPLR
jgi:hypothetical protein